MANIVQAQQKTQHALSVLLYFMLKNVHTYISKCFVLWVIIMVST